MDDLISKKELLDTYHISYGALYRWKRAGLIPEDWFIRKATPTGQETFFRKEQICPRVECILSRDTKQTLEDLAKELNGKIISEEMFIIETAYEKQRIPLSEIRTIAIEHEGCIIELLETIKEKTQHAKTKYED